MSRPATLLLNNTLYWVMRLYNPSDGVTLVDATGTPTVAVRKNGSSVADSVTVTKRASTTGIYDCSYNPAGEIAGDQFTMEESAVISAITYQSNWSFAVVTSALDAAGTRSAVGLATANLDTQLTTIDDFIDTEVTNIQDILKADRYIDTTATPWQLVLIKAGTGTLTTGTRLLVQNLKTEAAANITSISKFVGQSVAP